MMISTIKPFLFSMDKTHASDCKCECGKQAVAFWPFIDPDIPSHPYCRECLDKAKNSLLDRMYNEGLL